MKIIWKQLSERFFYNKFRQDILALASGNVAVQVISILSYPVLTRLYPDEVFGQYALFNSIVIILSFAITLRYEVAIPLAVNNDEALILKRSAIKIAVFITILLSLVAILIEVFNLYKPLKSYLIFIPIVALTTSILQVYRYWHLRIDSLVSYFKYLFSYRILYVGLALFIAFFYINLTNGLITALITASVLIFFTFLFFRPRDFWQNIKIDEVRNTLTKNYRFPKFALPSIIIGTISFQLPIFLITEYFGPSTTGQYSVAFGLLVLPNNLLITRISESLYQNYGLKDKHEIKSVVLKIWRALTGLLILPLILLFFFSEEIFVAILGDEWRLAGIIGRYMVPLIFLSSLSTSVSSLIHAFNLQAVSLYLSVFRIIYLALAFIIAGYTSDFLLGIFLMVVFNSLHNLVFMFIIYTKIK